MFTPHARGSTLFSDPADRAIAVYPACAGIDHSRTCSGLSALGLPRMRGDRPSPCALTPGATWFTPHARGSTLPEPEVLRQNKVYPACAGIDRRQPGPACGRNCLPRMRGDRPELGMRLLKEHVFTPHARGSTETKKERRLLPSVYPACAGIDPEGRERREKKESLPRMRGDRPLTEAMVEQLQWFTPHARGSTLSMAFRLEQTVVYPACAGIDLFVLIIC